MGPTERVFRGQLSILSLNHLWRILYFTRPNSGWLRFFFLPALYLYMQKDQRPFHMHAFQRLRQTENPFRHKKKPLLGVKNIDELGSINNFEKAAFSEQI